MLEQTWQRQSLAMQLIALEYGRAAKKFKPYNSAHEGHSVIREEVEELWDEIKHNKVEGAKRRQIEEAVQVASTALRFIINLGEGETLAAIARDRYQINI